MNIGVILPHTKIYGGVKRFLELGNRFVADDHQFTVFCPDSCWPDWFDYRGNTDILQNLGNYNLDAIFFTEIKFLDDVLSSVSRLKIFYHVYRRNYLKHLRKYTEIIVFVNSSNIYRYDRLRHPGRELVKAIGGVQMHEYQINKKSSREINVLTYGRISRKKKGTHLVVKACENLYKKGYPIHLTLFDTPVDEESRLLIENFQCDVPFDFIVNRPFHENISFFRKADIFVSVEKKAGWSNTSAEALAAGLPLVATRSGTMDFLIHKKTGFRVRRNVRSIQQGIKQMIHNPELRQQTAVAGYRKIKCFSWEKLYNTILYEIGKRLNEKIPNEKK